MPKKARKLSSKFSVESYKLELLRNPNGQIVSGRILISGKKIGPPAKRLVFHQKALKITAAKILYNSKKGPLEYRLVRINHHRGFEEVRLHVGSLMYPGSYQLAIDFIYQTMPPEIKKGAPLRGLFPCIDELGALNDFNVTYTDG